MRKITGEIQNPAAIRATAGRIFTWLLGSFALLLLGAHFFRAGNATLMTALVVIFGMHCTRNAWTAYAVSFVLALGSLEWMHSAWKLAAVRMHFAMPWARGAAILAIVALVTLLAAALASKRGRERHTADHSTSHSTNHITNHITGPAVSQAVVFILAFSLLLALGSARPGGLLLERFIPMTGGIQAALLAVYAAYLYGKLLDRALSRKTRQRAWAVFSILFFGQIALGMAGIYGPFDPSRLHIPVPGLVLYAPAFRGTFGMMPFLVLFATLLAGGAWCSMFCYFGPLDARAGKGPVKPPPPFLRAALVYGRWGTLILGLSAACALRVAGASSFTAGVAGTGFGIAGIIFMAVFSRRYHGMAHCAAWCPLGLVVNIVSALSPWRIRVDTATCNGCGVCEKICAYRAVTKESREQGGTLRRCTLCRDCVTSCPHKSLYVHSPLLPREKAERVFVATAAILHVLFIAAAKPY